MAMTNKDVMEQSAQVLAEKTELPDGPNVAPSPREHLAAQGIVQPAVHASGTGATDGAAADPAPAAVGQEQAGRAGTRDTGTRSQAPAAGR